MVGTTSGMANGEERVRDTCRVIRALGLGFGVHTVSCVALALSNLDVDDQC